MSEETRLATMHDLQSTEHRLTERLEKVETNLLTAFHEWARTYEVCAPGLGVTVRDFDERLGFIEERVAKLERHERQ